MPTGCVCVTPVAVAPYDSDDEALEAYEREVASRTSTWEPESSEAMPKPAAADSERTRAVDAYGFELQLTPEGARARARCAASAERRAPRWRVYRDDETDAAMRDARGRRLAKKSSVDANLTRLIRKGVPRDFRRRAWMSISGAASRRAAAPEGHYARVLRDAENALLEKDDEKRGARRSASGPTDVPPSVGSWLRPFAAQIDLDIPRTFPENPRYHGGASGGGGRAAVRNVLLAYAAEHPQTGYCQGMNYVAAFLWLAANVAETAPDAAFSPDDAVSDDAVSGSLREEKRRAPRKDTPSPETETEEATYWLFACLVDDVLAPEIFARDIRGTLREFRVLSLLLRSRAPRTHAHLEKHDMDLCMLQSKWLLCVFTESFPAETAARVLDVLFAEGHKAWLRVRRRRRHARRRDSADEARPGRRGVPAARLRGAARRGRAAEGGALVPKGGRVPQGGGRAPSPSRRRAARARGEGGGGGAARAPRTARANGARRGGGRREEEAPSGASVGEGKKKNANDKKR